jgi:hypothetical protein
MPDQQSIEELTQLDTLVQRVMAAETKSLADMQEAIAIMDRYHAAHPEGNESTHEHLNRAIQEIQTAMQSNLNLHTRLLGAISAARETAQNREPYQPSEL